MTLAFKKHTGAEQVKRKAIMIVTILVILLFGAGTFYYYDQNKQETSSDGYQSTTETATQKDVRETVWEQLSSGQKDAINGTWSDGEVSTVVLREGMMASDENKSYIGKEVYLIDFPTKSEGVPNNIIVYADIETHAYIGSGLVD